MKADPAAYTLLSATQEHNYVAALTRIFASQNTDGSWGRKSEYKVTLTSQAIQLMYALNISHDDLPFKKATRWMQDHVHRGDPHWATRLEVGLKIGEFENLVNDDYISAFLNDLEYDLSYPNEEARLDFFWHVIPTLIALHPNEESYVKRAGRSIPHDKVIECAMKYCRPYGDSYIAVLNQPNQTGLVALYLFTISNNTKYEKYRETVRSMINWLIMNYRDSEEGVHWQNSRGITSYILIDLLRCAPDNTEVQQIVPKILKYLTPNSNGSVKKDKVTTFGTELHSEQVYLMILVLRAMTEAIIKEHPNEIRRYYYEARKPHVRAFFYRLSWRFSYHRNKIPIFICFILCIVGWFAYKEQSDVGIMFLSTGLACILNILFDVIKAK